jgi:hypothetical protein
LRRANPEGARGQAADRSVHAGEHDIRRQEVQRLNKKLSHLDGQDLLEIEQSIERIFACACGLRRIFACNIPGSWMSSV